MPLQSKSHQITLWLALILTFGVCVIKAGAPQWVALAWVSLCGISMLTTFTIATFRSHTLQTSSQLSRQHNIFAPFLLFAAFQVWAFIQYLWVSNDKAASIEHSLIGMGMLFLFGIWYRAIAHKKALEALYTGILTFALLQAIYGIWVTISGDNRLLWMPKVHYLDKPTGFFVNANHFAAFMVLALILGISRLLSTAPSRIKQPHFVKLFNALYSPSNAILFFLAFALILSKSVGAIVSIIMVSFTLLLKTLIGIKDKRRLAAILITPIIMIFTATLVIDYSVVEGLTFDLSHTIDRRIDLTLASISMLKDGWFLGIGGGAFYSNFSPFRTLDIGHAYYNNAHNDILQFWIEYGLVGSVLIILFIVAALRNNLLVLSNQSTGIRATFAYASIYCTLAVFIHSLVDFPLRVPGFAVCYLVLILVNSFDLMHQQRKG